MIGRADLERTQHRDDNAERILTGLNGTERDDARRDDAARLIGVAINTLHEESEQIVRDYLNHALGALERIRAADRTGACSK